MVVLDKQAEHSLDGSLDGNLDGNLEDNPAHSCGIAAGGIAVVQAGSSTEAPVFEHSSRTRCQTLHTYLSHQRATLPRPAF